MAAFRNAVRVGADYVEMDVRETADGVLVLMHDKTVDRTTDGSGEVAKLTWRELAMLNAAAKHRGGRTRERIPTFEEAARYCRGRVGIYLDHKGAPVHKVLETLERASFHGPIVVFGSPAVLAQYRAARPELEVMCGHPPTASAMRDLWIRLSPLVLDGHLREWTPAEAEAARELGLRTWLDAMGPDDAPDGWTRAVSLGATAIQTDYPDRLRSWLRARGLHG